MSTAANTRRLKAMAAIKTATKKQCEGTGTKTSVEQAKKKYVALATEMAKKTAEKAGKATCKTKKTAAVAGTKKKATAKKTTTRRTAKK